MKNLIATLIVAVAATSALAAEPAKVEAVKKPEATATAVPTTPKDMPKVEKPKTKAEKEAVKKDAKPADTKSAAPATTTAPAAKADEKAVAKPATVPTK